MKSIFRVSETIANKIHFLRGERVLLDSDLAFLYGVETKRLNESARRNRDRFPDDFMFQLSEDEWSSLRTQIATLKGRGQHPKFLPFAFSEHGVAMLSGILKSPRAVETNIAIMRTFVALRKWMLSNKELAEKIRQLESRYDEQFKVVFDAIRQLINEEKETRPIGFRIVHKGS